MAKPGNYIITSKIIDEYDLGNSYIWPEFETEEQCDERRAEVIRVLKSQNEDGSFNGAIQMLEWCRDGKQSCNSPVCPVCMREYRRLFVSHGLKAMEGHEQVHFTTWVPDPEFPPSIPFQFDAAKFVERFLTHVNRYLPDEVRESVKVWGFVEIKMNTKLKTIIPHIHCVVAGCSRDDVKLLAAKKWDSRAGKYKLPKNRVIHRPLQVKTLDNDARVALFSYCCKTHHKGDRGHIAPPSKRGDTQRRKQLQKEAAKTFRKHMKFKFTERAYREFSMARPKIEEKLLRAELYHLLAGLNAHDMAVLRRITRKHVSRQFDWRTPDYGTPRRSRKGSLRRL